MRRGEASASPGSRQVSSGSSSATVPRPTRMASARARMRWPRACASGPVTQRGAPSPRAISPSCDTASLSCTNGRACVMRRMWPAAIQRASSAHRPRSTVTPAWRSRATPLPDDARVGVLDGAHHAGDAGLQDRVGARRRAAVMRAGLERDVHGLAARPLAGQRQHLGLGVRPAARLGAAARDDLARRLVDDHRRRRRGWGRCGRARAWPDAAPPACSADPAHRSRLNASCHPSTSMLSVGRLCGARLGSACGGRRDPWRPGRRSRPAPPGSRPPRGSRGRRRRSAHRRRGRDLSRPP